MWLCLGQDLWLVKFTWEMSGKLVWSTRWEQLNSWVPPQPFMSKCANPNRLAYMQRTLYKFESIQMLNWTVNVSTNALVKRLASTQRIASKKWPELYSIKLIYWWGQLINSKLTRVNIDSVTIPIIHLSYRNLPTVTWLIIKDQSGRYAY